MSDSTPAGRIVERIRGQPDGFEHAHAFVSILLAYAAGMAVWWLFGLSLSLTMIGSSLLASVVLVEAVLSNPPVS